MSQSEISEVIYENKQPQFCSEFKLQLPLKLSSKHHLFFTFFHVNEKTKKKGEDEVEVPIGFSFLPLYDDRFADSEQNLPVCTTKLEESKKWKHYLTEKKVEVSLKSFNH